MMCTDNLHKGRTGMILGTVSKVVWIIHQVLKHITQAERRLLSMGIISLDQASILSEADLRFLVYKQI